MKKIYLGLLGLLALVGCTNDDFETPKANGLKTINTVSLTMADGAGTRSYLAGDLTVKWNPDDEIIVFSDVEGRTDYYLSEGSDGYEFAGEAISGNIFYVAAPNYDNGEDYLIDQRWSFTRDNDPTQVGYDLPGRIVMADNGYNMDAVPMVAKSEDDHFLLKNTVGLLKFSVYGNMHVKRITLTGNNDEVLNGKGVIDMTAEEPILVMNGEEYGKSNRMLVLSYVDEWGYIGGDGEFIVSEDTHDFYFPVPVQTFANGVTLKMEGFDDDGNWNVMQKSTDKKIVVGRGVVKEFDVLDVDGIVESIKTLVSPAEEDVFTDNGYSTTWEVHTNVENVIDKMESVAGALRSMADDDLRRITLIMPEAFSVPNEMFYEAAHLEAFIGENVEFVGDDAFNILDWDKEYSIKEVILPKVKKIGNDAFRYTRIESVDFPLLTEIGSYAFSESNLASFNLPLLRKVDEGVFSSTRITEVDLPELEVLSEEEDDEGGYYLFANCANLTTVNLPKLPYVAGNMFAGCKSLTSIYLPMPTKIGYNGFADCTALESVDIPSATYLGSRAFYNCKKLTEVNLPNVKNISYQAFQGCIELTSISLPKAVNLDGYEIFANCTKLTSIDLPLVKKIGGGNIGNIFSSCGVKNLILPSVESIGVCTFGSSKLITLELPMVKYIGSYIFEDTYSLQRVTIGGGENWDGMIDVDEDAFVVFDGYLGQCTLHLNGLAMYGAGANQEAPYTESVTATDWSFTINEWYDEDEESWEVDSKSVDLSNFGHVYVNGVEVTD